MSEVLKFNNWLRKQLQRELWKIWVTRPRPKLGFEARK
jgi:hypothetical protein